MTQKPLLTLARNYFTENPTQKDSVMKAYHAFHSQRHDPGAHYFLSSLRSSQCHGCGRSRNEVRYDDLPADCQSPVAPLDAKAILAEEEMKFHEHIAKAQKVVPKIIAKRGMSGETLAFIHQTHGWCPEVVGDIVAIDAEIIEVYHREREEEANLSRSRVVREVISIK